MGARDVPANDTDTRIADGEQTAGAEEAYEYADKVAVSNAHNHDSDSQQQVQPGVLQKRPPEGFDDKTVAE
jgi:hypothetical protein